MNSPAAANTYKGPDAEYITFNYTEIPDDFGDDDAGHYRALVQVHYFAPHELNTRATRREITRRIVAAGAVYYSGLGRERATLRFRV